MNKIAIYLLLLFSYIGLYKSFSPNETAITSIAAIGEIDEYITSTPATVILENVHSTGSLIKTYYLKMKVVYPFYTPQEIVVRTTKEFARKNIEYIGMSIYRKETVKVEKSKYSKYSKRKDEEKEVSYTTPVVPGLVYLNKSSFGWWKRKNKKLTWRFYRTYRDLPTELGWGKFRPTKDFYLIARDSFNNKEIFWGLENEFGPKGKITQLNFPDYFNKLKETQIDFKNLLKDYTNSNFSKIRLE
jgi:hypothetical protein